MFDSSENLSEASDNDVEWPDYEAEFQPEETTLPANGTSRLISVFAFL